MTRYEWINLLVSFYPEATQPTVRAILEAASDGELCYPCRLLANIQA